MIVAEIKYLWTEFMSRMEINIRIAMSMNEAEWENCESKVEWWYAEVPKKLTNVMYAARDGMIKESDLYK